MSDNQTTPQPEFIRDLPPIIRPISRLDHLGVEALSESELLALVLHSRSLQTIETLLSRLSIQQLLQMPFSRLASVDGVGRAGAAAILAAAELTRRADKKVDAVFPTIQCTSDIAALALEIRDKKKEYLLAFFLNARRQLICKEVISIGTLTASLAHPREIFSPAIGKAAAAVILAHNHPSGDPSPSDEDLRLTARIKQAGHILGIELIDHLILAEKGSYSFKTASGAL